MVIADKKTRHFRVTDGIILAILTALIVAGIWYVRRGREIENGRDVRVSYEVRILSLRSEMTAHVHYGDTVYDAVYKTPIGTVEKVRTEQYTETIYSKNTGELVESVKPGYYNLYITVNTTAKFRNDTYTVSETVLRVGEKVSMHLPDFCGIGYCVSLKTAETEE